MKLDILQPKIFPADKIISGVTKRNAELFPPYGLSVSTGQIMTWGEVYTHRKVMAESLGYHFSDLKFQLQKHESNIREIFKGSPEIESDGMISSQKGLILNIIIADCCGILLYDTKKNAIAALHSGWKGTSMNIASKGVELMKERYKSNTGDILAYLSPCAGGDDYEVGEEVAKLFTLGIKPKENGKFLLDIRQIILKQLTDTGIPSQNIEVSDISTITNTDYHSHRRDGEKAGRMSAFIGMSE